MDTVIVSGAGSEEVNGTYIENGTVEGRPQYLFDSEGSSDVIFWAGASDGWIITSDDGNPYYAGPGEDVEFPWLVETWINYQGGLPVPTVTLYVEPEPETENTFGLPAETVALITSRFGTVANFLRLRNQGQV
jgi:hypothetical protein